MLVVPFNPNANTDSVGLWKDNLFACTRYGLAHPSFLSAYFCPLILLGQIMTRLKMDWRGNETSTVEWNKTFRTMLLIAIFCKIIIIIDYISVSVLASAVVCFYWIYLWYLLLEVRKHIRDRDRIPADHGLIGDAIKSFFCTCCTISQLARQTANYDVANASFCTQDGVVLNQAHTIDGDVEIV
jgi:Cys-rich protein (TIGR01571 family)